MIKFKEGGLAMNDLFERFFGFITSHDFFKFYVDLSNLIFENLNSGLANNLREPEIVKSLVCAFNKSIKIKNSKIKTYGIFLHGRKSMVQFNYYGRDIQKELGDMLFLLTVVFNKRILFEKCSISQFKKSSNGIKRFWKIDEQQLYLLSRFPEFEGVSGLLKDKKLKLNNGFGSLGSYILLYSPGDFTYVTAPILETLLGGKSCIKHRDFSLLCVSPCYLSSFCFMPNISALINCIEDCFDYSKYRFFELLIRCRERCGYSRYRKCFYSCFPPLFSMNYAHTYNDFLYCYLTGKIGEIIMFDGFVINTIVKTMIENIFNMVKKICEQSQGSMQFFGSSNQNTNDIIENIEGYLKNVSYDNNGEGGDGDYDKWNDFDPEGGGFGIIHTIINLGEGEK